MNRTTTLPLLTALACAMPLAALAQTGASAAAEATIQATASAATDAAGPSVDDKTFEQTASVERQRIADGRAAANARYEQDRRACWQRFAVNDCLDRARDNRRTVLDALRHDELALNAQERQRRSAARLDEIARKQAESAKRNGSHDTDTPASAAQVQ